jgi:hypothetical protein
MEKEYETRYLECKKPVQGGIYSTIREIARYKLELMCVQEVMWYKGGTLRARGYILFYEKENENHVGTGFFVHHNIVSAVKRVQSVSDRHI